ncbi:D-beta-hydroxybutyrate dehydrogenase [Planctomycetales bacterium 10988]|nr:D-beta-hydroxybutyrate dehydrogenase [Planctomycetales bacterium 10988]
MKFPEMFNLQGKVALITGGSQGLGKAMATGLAQAGADIFLCSRSEDKLKAALKEILTGTESKGSYFVADLTKREETKALAEAALDEFGRVDIFINNAGTNIPEPIDEVSEDKWDQVIELNLSAGMLLSKLLVPQMKERNWGRIIHISSVMGLASKAGRAPYSASKSGLLGLMRGSALDLGLSNITVNCIAPGPFLTDLPKSLLDEEAQAAFSAQTALKRWGQPEELMGPALLLASDAGSYITGETIVVDGGGMAKTLE